MPQEVPTQLVKANPRPIRPCSDIRISGNQKGTIRISKISANDFHIPKSINRHTTYLIGFKPDVVSFEKIK